MQTEQIRTWATTHGATLGQVFEELDESGAGNDRPLLRRAIERVELGESQGVVVAKLDRFGRSLVDSLAAIDRIQASGGTFVAVEDGLDLRTDTGRLVLRMMLSMAEWELDRIRTSWSRARRRAVARGVHIGAVAPTGYRRGANGLLEPDPDTRAAISEAFRRRAADRHALAEIGRYLESQGVATPWGNRGWIYSSVKRMLANRVYLGEVRHGDFVNERAHEPLIDPATWHAAQWSLEISPPRSSSPPSLCAGLLRCAGCRLVLGASANCSDDGRPWRTYRCKDHTARWPPYAEFALAGELRLWDQVRRHGGAARWAKRMKLAYTAQHHRSPTDWSEQQVRAALAPFLRARTDWPSWKEFRAARLTTLRRAVNEHGGATRWSDEFGLALTGKKKGPRPRWTDERMEQALREFIGQVGRWPGRLAFEAAGLSGLYQAMQRRNGIRVWAERAEAFTAERGA